MIMKMMFELDAKIKEHDKKYEAFQKGKIKKREWNDYCMETLEELLEINKDVLDRLKNQWYNKEKQRRDKNENLQSN